MSTARQLETNEAISDANMGTELAVAFVRSGDDLFAREEPVYIPAKDYDPRLHRHLKLFCACCWDREEAKKPLSHSVVNSYTKTLSRKDPDTGETYSYPLTFPAHYQIADGEKHACGIRQNNRPRIKALLEAVRLGELERVSFALRLPSMTGGRSGAKTRDAGNANDDLIPEHNPVIGSLKRLVKLIKAGRDLGEFSRLVSVQTKEGEVPLTRFFSANALGMSDTLPPKSEGMSMRAFVFTPDPNSARTVMAEDGYACFVRHEKDDSDLQGAVNVYFEGAANAAFEAKFCSRDTGVRQEFMVVSPYVSRAYDGHGNVHPHDVDVIVTHPAQFALRETLDL